MGKNIIKSLLDAGGDVTNNQVADFFPKLLDGLTNSITNGRRPSFGQLLNIADAGNDTGDYNPNRRLSAIFIVCAKREHIGQGKPFPSDEDIAQLVLGLEYKITRIFEEILDFRCNFKFHYCLEDIKTVPEALLFNDYEDFETKRDLFVSENIRLGKDKNESNKNKIHKGIKVIELLPAPASGAAVDVHSNAELGGIAAHVYIHHMRDFVNKALAFDTRSYDFREFDITIIHEILHLFGLADRYQFLLTYTLGPSGDCIADMKRTLIPFAVNPKIDPEGLYHEHILNNIMYGIDNICRKITTYQRKIVLGYLPVEEAYKKVTVLVPEGASLTTKSSPRGLFKLQKPGSNDTGNRQHTPIIGAEEDGTMFTYINVENETDVRKEYSGDSVYLGNQIVGKNMNDLIGIVMYEHKDHGKPKQMQQGTNALGLKLEGFRYCDGRTLLPVSALSEGD
jgi:hypothetical protein